MLKRQQEWFPCVVPNTFSCEKYRYNNNETIHAQQKYTIKLPVDVPETQSTQRTAVVAVLEFVAITTNTLATAKERPAASERVICMSFAKPRCKKIKLAKLPKQGVNMRLPWTALKTCKVCEEWEVNTKSFFSFHDTFTAPGLLKKSNNIFKKTGLSA